MEPSTTSNKSNGEILSRSDHDESLINFTKTVLNLENSSNSVSSGDSAVMSSPERDLWQSQSCSEDQVDDRFEGILYKTYITSCMTKLKFISVAFFKCFYDKMKADYHLDIINPENNPVSTCLTHVRGLKCEMLIDRDSKSVKVSGVGHRMWRKEYFPRVSTSLFKRYVQENDSQFCGEEITNSVSEEKKEEHNGSRYHQVQPESVALSTTDFPMFTSTPIVQRTDSRSEQSSAQNSTYSECLLSIVNMIRRMETELKEIKQNVVSSMERKIDELKASLLVLFEQSAKKEKSFSAVLQEVSHGSRDVDEGFCNDTASSHVLGTSQTHPKTLFQKENLTETVHVNPNDVTQADAMQPKTTPMQPEARHKTPVQQVPVRITTRDTTRQTQSSRPVTSQCQTDKTLLIGDSLLNPVNTKGLIRGTHKHARSGATISDITNDISFYDVKAFSNIIISVGGNDASQKTEEELFEEKYDQLISLIKTSSPKTTVYICKIVPRGDVDVSSLNTCIERLGLHWQKHDVICISKTSDYFCGKNRVPTERYYSIDGIHLSRSGVKRLLDAINSTVKIVDKYEMCVFSKPGNQRNTGNYHIRTNSGQEQRRGRQGSRYGERRHANKRCYACRMMGHISSECWN